MKRSEKRKQLEARYADQDGHCYYCLRVTCLPGHGRPSLAYLSPKTAHEEALKNLQATREHLRRRSDGGGDEIGNIVMACMECNGDRELRSVLEHVKAMRQKHGAAAPEREVA